MVLPRVHQVTSPKARAILADFLLGFISPKKIGFWIVWKRCFHLCYIVSTDILTKVSSLRKQEWRILLCNYFVISATNVCPASLPVNVVSRRRTWERTRAIDFLTLTKVESTRKWKWNRGCRRFGQEVEERLRSCLGGVTWRWPILTSDTSWRRNRGLRTTALELESESGNWLSQKNWLVCGNEETLHWKQYGLDDLRKEESPSMILGGERPRKENKAVVQDEKIQGSSNIGWSELNWLQMIPILTLTVYWWLLNQDSHP